MKKTRLLQPLREIYDLPGRRRTDLKRIHVHVLFLFKYASDVSKSSSHSFIKIPADRSFGDFRPYIRNSNFGDLINSTLREFAHANDLYGFAELADFSNVTTYDSTGIPRDLREVVERLYELDFTHDPASGYRALESAIEFSSSTDGLHTPDHISRLITNIVGIRSEPEHDTTLYDPTCGQASLLSKLAAATSERVKIFGQELDPRFSALARVNLLLHGHPDADIRSGDTLADPKFFNSDGQFATFDFVVSDPPYTLRWDQSLSKSYDLRFSLGLPPKSNADFAFLLHVVASLNTTGNAAVVLPHGVLFRGNTERKIREQLIRSGLIKSVIGLPGNLLSWTSIPVCIIVLSKKNAEERTGIFMVDASGDYAKENGRFRLRERDVRKISDVVNKCVEIDGYSRMVPLDEIAHPTQNYDLSISRYIKPKTSKGFQDLGAQLHGGIPDRDIDSFNVYWNAFPLLRRKLFTLNRPGYSDLSVDPSLLHRAITGSTEFHDFSTNVRSHVNQWIDSHEQALFKLDHTPIELIETIRDNLHDHFDSVSLINQYDVYEQLMTYWEDSMNADIVNIIDQGWFKAAKAHHSIRTIIAQNSRSEIGQHEIELEQIKNLMLDLWRRDLVDRISCMADSLAHEFADQLTALSDRYADPLCSLQSEIQRLESLTSQHLAKHRLG